MVIERSISRTQPWKSEHSRGRTSPRGSGAWSTSTISASAACRTMRSRRASATARSSASIRGVFAVGYLPLSLEGRFLAAVKACGPGAVLSHFSAVVHWRLRPWIEHLPHVTSPGLRRRDGHHAPPLGAHRAARSTRASPSSRPHARLFDVSSMLAVQVPARGGQPGVRPRARDPDAVDRLPRSRREEAAQGPRHRGADEVREREPRAASHPRGRPAAPAREPEAQGHELHPRLLLARPAGSSSRPTAGASTAT